MHRHQLDGGHAQPGQVANDGRAGQARIGAALRGRDPGMAQGQAADMRLVDHRLVIGGSRRPVTRPTAGVCDTNVMTLERAVQMVFELRPGTGSPHCRPPPSTEAPRGMP